MGRKEKFLMMYVETLPLRRGANLGVSRRGDVFPTQGQGWKRRERIASGDTWQTPQPGDQGPIGKSSHVKRTAP